mmetsp:Transcript_4421/g.8947  ORF Transcript_4421/g.8947 Transcript_4421/m.8947 type:complete len:269 (+) Transcript_4421:881-1687(+)
MGDDQRSVPGTCLLQLLCDLSNFLINPIHHGQIQTPVLVGNEGELLERGTGNLVRLVHNVRRPKDEERLLRVTRVKCFEHTVGKEIVFICATFLVFLRTSWGVVLAMRRMVVLPEVNNWHSFEVVKALPRVACPIVIRPSQIEKRMLVAPTQRSVLRRGETSMPFAVHVRLIASPTQVLSNASHVTGHLGKPRNRVRGVVNLIHDVQNVDMDGVAPSLDSRSRGRAVLEHIVPVQFHAFPHERVHVWSNNFSVVCWPVPTSISPPKVI